MGWRNRCALTMLNVLLRSPHIFWYHDSNGLWYFSLIVYSVFVILDDFYFSHFMVNCKCFPINKQIDLYVIRFITKTKAEQKNHKTVGKRGENQNWICERCYRLISIISEHLNTHTIETTRNEYFVKCAKCRRFNEFMSWLLILKWDWCENLHLEMKVQHNFSFFVVPVFFLLIFILISEWEESGKEIVCSTATWMIWICFAFASISLNTLLWIVFAAGASSSPSAPAPETISFIANVIETHFHALVFSSSRHWTIWALPLFLIFRFWYTEHPSIPQSLTRVLCAFLFGTIDSFPFRILLYSAFSIQFHFMCFEKMSFCLIYIYIRIPFNHSSDFV